MISFDQCCRSTGRHHSYFQAAGKLFYQESSKVLVYDVSQYFFLRADEGNAYFYERGESKKFLTIFKGRVTEDSIDLTELCKIPARNCVRKGTNEMFVVNDPSTSSGYEIYQPPWKSSMKLAVPKNLVDCLMSICSSRIYFMEWCAEGENDSRFTGLIVQQELALRRRTS